MINGELIDLVAGDYEARIASSGAMLVHLRRQGRGLTLPLGPQGTPTAPRPGGAATAPREHGRACREAGGVVVCRPRTRITVAALVLGEDSCDKARTPTHDGLHARYLKHIYANARNCHHVSPSPIIATQP